MQRFSSLVGRISINVDSSDDAGAEPQRAEVRPFGPPFRCLGQTEAHSGSAGRTRRLKMAIP
jgi:hypothetical protein